MTWIHNETKSCPRCSNPIEVPPIPALLAPSSIFDPIAAEKWWVQSHEVRALLLAFLLALHV
jgi:hypothetical protein